jgi:hypothetical protein
VTVPREGVAAVGPKRLERRVSVLEPAVLHRDRRVAREPEFAIDVEGRFVHATGFGPGAQNCSRSRSVVSRRSSLASERLPLDANQSLDGG